MEFADPPENVPSLLEGPVRKKAKVTGSITTGKADNNGVHHKAIQERRYNRRASSSSMNDATSSSSDYVIDRYGTAPSTQEIESFFLKEPVTSEERKLVEPILRVNIESVLKKLEQKGAGKAYREYVEARKSQERVERQRKAKEEKSYDESAVFKGIPRSYQIKLMNRAAEMNTIVHLGTGMGKTLIAVLLIKRMTGLDEEGKESETSGKTEDSPKDGDERMSTSGTEEPNETTKKKQTKIVFLVPSVALVLQQTATMKANLPLLIGTAYRATVNSERSRKQLAKCDMLVATHGAYLDLLLHFGDLFTLEEVKLLILDECHNCVKNSPYATLMRQFYHPLAKEQRPRVLGLTASPLINMKKNCSHEELAQKLNELETTLDARVVPLTDLGLEAEDIPAFLRKEAKEEIVTFQKAKLSIGHNNFKDFNWDDNFQCAGLNRAREKEFRQLQALYEDLGPRVTQILCEQLGKEITRNVYEQESAAEFQSAHKFLHTVVTHCKRYCRLFPQSQYTPKLRALHSLLNQQLGQRPDAVGLIFVQRRVTALALAEHFRLVMAQRHEHKHATSPEISPSKENQVVEECYPIADNSDPTDTMGQFDDADEDADVTFDVEVEPIATTPNESSLTIMNGAPEGISENMDQFDDAMEDDPFEIAAPAATKPSTQLIHSGSFVDDSIIVDVKSSALVRKASSMFRVTRKSEEKKSKKHQRDSVDVDEIEKEEATSLRQHEISIREVLSKMRRREINVLIATSVVEEGVDVQACSFVVVFDALTSLKAFIQMKGRARQKDAFFFVFEEEDVDNDAMPLSTVKDVEARVNEFLASRKSSNMALSEAQLDTSILELTLSDGDEMTCEEEKALEDKEFRTKHGLVAMRGAKSLLHRYALMQPMDPAVRTSRASMRAHLPSFDHELNQLSLPSHVGTYEDIRIISLPNRYVGRPKKERESLVSLRACVRLYKHGLLNDRLLPLSEHDIQQRFVKATQRSASREATVNVMKPVWSDLGEHSTIQLYLHPIVYRGETLEGYLNQFNSEGKQLGILSWTPIVDIPNYDYSTGQMGNVVVTLGEGITVSCSSTQVETASKFFDLVWNARWKRRTLDTHFRCSESSSSYFVYRIVCLNNEGNLDWEHMDELIKDSERSAKERTDIVKNIDTKITFSTPRLWSPTYDENACYLVFGPSSDVCDSVFPHDHHDERIKTYKDYYEFQHQVKVPADSILYDAVRQWQLPRRAWSESHEEVGELKQVKLPHVVCMEAVLANAGISLLTILLPQFCHHVEICVALQKFLEHVTENIPDLAQFLTQIPRKTLLDAITAKSCNATGSYEKLEWLGDGVLKLVQTDALINSTDLGNWIRHLPEGYLNSARSFMGSNRTLAVACKKLKLERFIQTESLSRGLWTPAPMELVDGQNKPVDSQSVADGKVCADVLESLLGLVYLEFGYREALIASDALQLTIPHKDDELLESTKMQAGSLNAGRSIDAVETFTGYHPFVRKSLVEEALTHPTKLSVSTSYSSYQRLEWIGDAVLCLAMRCWIYKNMPQLELGSMVLLEATLVCNETLAFLAQRASLAKHLRHGDQTLPGRIENYEWSVQEDGRGLWGTDPPKALADIVEAIFGAVFIDGGIHAGQKAVYHAFRSILDSIKSSSDKEIERYCCHPKRSILSELGCLVSLEQRKEETLSVSSPSLNVWCGDDWRHPHATRSNPVLIMKCLGDTMMAVSDHVASSAMNRACYFVLSFLFENKEYINRFRKLKADVQRSWTGKEVQFDNDISSDIPLPDDENDT